MSLTIRCETAADVDAIRQVNGLAFGQKDEGQLVDDLRAGGYVRLSLVAEQDQQVIGHVLFSAMSIVAERGVVPALALAPLAVLPQHQRRGIGAALVRRGLELCRDQGHRIAIVLGHPEYYQRFGFSSALASPLRGPFSGEAWMALELVPQALEGVTGVVDYPPPFGLG